MLLTVIMAFAGAQTAEATIRTVTYTITDTRSYTDNGKKFQATFTATGDINATYTVNVPDPMDNALAASWTLGDFQFNWTSSSDDCYFEITGDNVIHGTNLYHNWTFTISSDTYYIDHVEYYNQSGTLKAEQDNDTKSLALTTTNYSMGGISGSGIHAFTVNYSDSPAYRITYELNGGKNADANPKWYETATGVASLANPTRDYYDFGGWYDNADFNGTPLTSIAAGTTGAKTLYAKWTAHTYNITYHVNEGTMPFGYRTSYTVETNTFDLPTPTRSNYYFRGWYTNEDFASAKYTQIKKGTHQDFTFYAKWEKYDENGDGTKENPLKIRNEADLRALATKVNGGDNRAGVYYQQTENITITGGDWTPIGTQDNYFSGIYDGGNYTISGIRISSESGFQGLFGKVTGTSDKHWGFIQNIVLESSTIAGGNYTGGIVGCLGNGHVLNCHVRSDVTVQATVDGTSSSQKERFGGVVGWFQNGTVTDCTSMAIVNNGGHSYVRYLGGIIGYMTQGNNKTATATNCFSYGMKAIGARSSGSYGGTVTNVERVYSMSCTDGSITLPDAVDKTDGFYYGGTGYYKAGVSVPLTVTLTPTAGYCIKVKQGSTTLSPDEYGQYAATTTEADATVKATIIPDPAHFSKSGGTYTIHDETGWGLFCDCLNDNDTYNRFSGKTVKLGDDITITRAAGSDANPFCGTFDGQENTLTANITETENQGTAPFRAISGATIRNLRVAGSVTGTAHAAGLVGFAKGSSAATVNTIENCLVETSVTVTTDDVNHHQHTGGVVGHAFNSTLNLNGVAFTGTLANNKDYAGGLQGWSDGNTLNITDCLFAGSYTGPVSNGFHPVALSYLPGQMTATVARCYYTAAPTSNIHIATAQGAKAYALTTAPANLGAAVTGVEYTVLTAYANGILFDGKYYVAPAAVTLADNATNDLTGVSGYVADVTLQGRTLYTDGAWNTLCLPFALGDASAADGHHFDGTPLEGFTAKELDTETAYGGHVTGLDGTTLYLNFKDATSIAPGRPYIVKKDGTGGIQNPVFQGVTIPDTYTTAEAIAAALAAAAPQSTDGAVTFAGSYSPVTLDAGDQTILYLGAASTLYWPSADKTVGSCRALFHLGSGLTAGEPTSQVRAFNLNFGEGSGDTGIVSVSKESRSQGVAAAWYTLDGVRLDAQPTRKGLYIHGGRKVVIK